MTLYKHAKNELEILEEMAREDDTRELIKTGKIPSVSAYEMQKEMSKDVLQLIEKMSKQGHSGFSANILIGYFKQLAEYRPLTELQGTEEEWNDVRDNLQQNKRCSAIFRKNGDNKTAHYNNGYYYSDNYGESWYSCRESSKKISFPCAPEELKPEYRKLWLGSLMPIKWQVRLHLYTTVK